MKFLSFFPSVDSRLGDIGFTDEGGTWQRILNITDEESCRKVEVEPLKLSRARQHYITQVRYGHSQDPFVKIPEGWESDVLGKVTLEKFPLFLSCAYFPVLSGTAYLLSAMAIYR